MKIKVTVSVIYSADVNQHFSKDNFKEEKDWLNGHVKFLWPGTVHKFKITSFRRVKKLSC